MPAADVPPAEPAAPKRLSFAGQLGSMWLYTTLRFALFFALWGIMLLLGLSTLLAALVGLVLSVPLSFVLLAKPRAAFTANLTARVDARREERSQFDAELDPDAVGPVEFRDDEGQSPSTEQLPGTERRDA